MLSALWGIPSQICVLQAQKDLSTCQRNCWICGTWMVNLASRMEFAKFCRLGMLRLTLNVVQV